MAWNEPGGDKNKGSKDPWNNDGRGGGQGPDVDAFIERLKSNIGRVFGGGDDGRSGRGRGTGNGNSGPSIGLIVLGALLLWFVFDSWVLIDERQRGVVLRFGKYERLMTPGPNFKLPRPIESVIKVEATQVRNISDQVRMLTRDENIVLVDFNVQYQVSDPQQFLFGTRDPDDTLRQAAESAVREVMGNSVMDTIPSGQRAELAAQAIARAQGDAERFTLLADEYRKAPAVTRKRLYLETMQEVLAANPKVVAGNRNGNNVMYLPLDKLSGGAAGTPRSDTTFVERLPPIQAATTSPSSRTPVRDATRTPREGSSR